MVRMLLVGYCFGIRSERRLCEEVPLNLAYRWFCHLVLGSSDSGSLDQRIDMAAFARAMYSGTCSRA